MSNCEIKITLSADEYRAYADFIPALGEGAELSTAYARSVINEAGIIHGVDWDLVDSTILYCNTNKKIKKGVEIAVGTPPSSEVPEYWNLEKKFFEHAMGFEPKELKVNYKERSPFIMVKKGELIATLVNSKDGVLGLSVKKIAIPFKKKKIVQFTPGKNTLVADGKLHSATSGRYDISDSKIININDVLTIEGNVDYSTGNISFAKDVIIEGEVKDGFKVAVGGSLHCKNNLDASDILCRKDLIIDQGVIGHGTALVRVGGELRAKFVENCDVESKKGIFIEKNVMNSTLFTLGNLELGEKGSIVSSYVHAELSVKTYDLGKDGSPNSEITIGSSFVAQRSINALKQRLDVLKAKLTKLERLPDYRKTDKKLQLIEQISAVVVKGSEELSLKQKNINKYLDASISVFGTAFPGNLLIICGIKYSITEEKRKVKFYLNSESNRIESVPL
ncbi:MAG: hypothetical protein B6229_08890 [Spirochaetaceae bacterium 4572_7]|nr:MAG: hypothetical protein B6229_08890 [Spirochaetaceae bacterium 4572_7]